MRKSFVVLAALSLTSVPAIAQTTDQATAAPAAPQAEAKAKPKMIKKRVCTKSEAITGSRTSGSKVCKTIEVPANTSAEAEKGHHDHSASGATN